MRKTFSIFVLIIAVLSIAAHGQATVVKSAGDAKRLLGTHKFSLQWIGWDYFGKAAVINKKGLYRLTGEQRQRGGSDFVRIDGKITSIDQNSFTFSGRIETRVSHINNGETCTRDGEMTFRITGKRRYWRLMQMDNPCDAVTDYIDIFFR